MSRFLTLGAAGLAALAVFLFLRLSMVHEALGRAELAARLNANTVAALQDQEQRNQALDARVEQRASARDTVTRGALREIFVQPSGDACRRSAAMRTLDGRLRYQPSGDGDRSSAAAAIVPSVPAAGRSSR